MLPSERAEARKQKHSSPFLLLLLLPLLAPWSIFSPKYQLYGYRRATDRPTDHDYSLFIPLDTLMKMRAIFQSEFKGRSSLFFFLSLSLSLTRCDASYSAATPQLLTTVSPSVRPSEPRLVGCGAVRVRRRARSRARARACFHTAVAPVARHGTNGGSLYELPFGFY